MVKSGGKCSDPHKFFYTINGGGSGSGSGGGLSFSGLLDTSTSSSNSAAISDVCSSSAADVVSTFSNHGECYIKWFYVQRANSTGAGSFPLIFWHCKC